MDISMKLNKIEAINLIKKNIDLFCFFDKSYIFGSVLKPDKYSEDIDVLLLYSTFSYDIQKSVNEIIELLQKHIISICDDFEDTEANIEKLLKMSLKKKLII